MKIRHCMSPQPRRERRLALMHQGDLYSSYYRVVPMMHPPIDFLLSVIQSVRPSVRPANWTSPLNQLT